MIDTHTHTQTPGHTDRRRQRQYPKTGLGLKGVRIVGQADGRTERTIHRAAWSQLKSNHHWLNRKLWYLKFPFQPVMKISLKLWRFVSEKGVTLSLKNKAGSLDICHKICARGGVMGSVNLCYSSLRHRHWDIIYTVTLQWRHNELDSVSYHKPRDCLLKRLFRRRSKKTSKLRVTGLCEGNSPGTGEFPAHRASNAENNSISWRHHEICQRQRSNPQEYG